MDKVRAKFRFVGIKTNQYGPDETQISRTMEFNVVGQSSEENKAFWDSTPSGRIEIQVVNKEACKRFEIGKEYYVDFIQAN